MLFIPLTSIRDRILSIVLHKIRVTIYTMLYSVEGSTMSTDFVDEDDIPIMPIVRLILLVVTIYIIVIMQSIVHFVSDVFDYKISHIAY